MLHLAVPRRLFAPRTSPEATPGNATDRTAKRVVWGVWFVLVALLFVYAAKTATQLPLLDEYFHVPLLIDPLGARLSAYWAQHNEHRIPLPRVLFVLAAKLAGNDFRAPPFLIAAALSITAAILMRAVARARGGWRYTDAAVPALILSLGQYENLLWGFQIQFVASTVMALLMMAIVLNPRFAESHRSISAVGILTLLEPLCGANGVALVPAFLVLLIAIAVHNFTWQRTRLAATAMLFAAAGVALAAFYFRGLQPAPQHTMTRSWLAVAEGFVNFTGLGFGSVVLRTHAGSLTGFAEISVAAFGLLLLTGSLLVEKVRTSDKRMSAIGLGCVLVGTLCLGAGLAYGRAAMGGVLAANRYTTLAMPLAVGMYVVGSISGTRRGRFAAWLVAATAFLGFWPNLTQAFSVGQFWHEKQSRIERDIRSGMPLAFVVDRYHSPGEREMISQAMLQLRENRIGPFAELVLDSPLDEVAVPLRVVRTEGVVREASGSYRVEGQSGVIVLALPESRHVYGFLLRYQAESPTPFFLLGSVSWEPGGRAWSQPDCGVTGHLHPAPLPVSARIFADRTTDSLRIELTQRGAAIRIHELSLLAKRP